MAKILIPHNDCQHYLGCPGEIDIKIVGKLSVLAHYLKLMGIRGVYCNYMLKKVYFCNISYLPPHKQIDSYLCAKSNILGVVPEVLDYQILNPHDTSKIFSPIHLPTMKLSQLFKHYEYKLHKQGYQLCLTLV